jgi:acylphosphatase
MEKTVGISISGQVQGVFFRQCTKEMAIKLGVNGGVKNHRDGSVYIIATGTQEKIEQLIEWCRVGPSNAKVENVEVKELPLQDFENFTIIR